MAEDTRRDGEIGGGPHDHIYGTDIIRVGSSVRRYYALPNEYRLEGPDGWAARRGLFRRPRQLIDEYPHSQLTGGNS